VLKFSAFLNSSTVFFNLPSRNWAPLFFALLFWDMKCEDDCLFGRCAWSVYFYFLFLIIQQVTDSCFDPYWGQSSESHSQYKSKKAKFCFASHRSSGMAAMSSVGCSSTILLFFSCCFSAPGVDLYLLAVGFMRSWPFLTPHKSNQNRKTEKSY